MADEEKKSVIDVLSELSGVTKPDIRAMAELVRANLQKLDNCVGPHEFVPFEMYNPNSPKSLIRTYKCVRCEGTLETSKVRWYEIGLKHGEKKR